MTTVWTVLAVVLAIGTLIIPVILTLAKGKRDLLSIAKAISKGIDDAKGLLPDDSKKALGGALKGAAEAAGKHEAVKGFLEKYGFNKPSSG